MTIDNPRFARRAAPPTSKSIWREWTADYWAGFALAAVVVALLTMAYRYHQYEMLDLWHSPNQTGQAVVISNTWNGGDTESGYSLHPQITLQLHGQIMTYDMGDPTKLKAIQAGDRVEVVYRTGKSGHIYLSYITRIVGAAKRQVPVDPASRTVETSPQTDY